MKDFEKEIAELLEVDTVNDEDILEEFESWDSLTVLSIIAHVDENYKITISANDLNEAKNIGSLKRLIESRI
jgi:acyl carrier protein